MKHAVILTEGLGKIYRSGFWKTSKVLALDNLNIKVYQNEIFGCLGPNGAGKSTTLKLLMSLIHPSSGKAEILGKPVSDISCHRHIGYLPENPYFYEYLTAEEFLSFYASLFEYSRSEIEDRVEHFLKQTSMFHFRKLQLRKFSKGMIQRVGIAQAIINDPMVVFLDEPMSGLDPIGRREVRDMILRLKEEGRTVFFSTHILNDVETLCDRVAILNRGKVIGSGLLSELVGREVTHVEVVVSGISKEGLMKCTNNAGAISESGTTLRVEMPAESKLGEIICSVEEASGKIVSISPIRQTMEEYFLKIVDASIGSAVTTVHRD